jgi:hypothetical protein
MFSMHCITLPTVYSCREAGTIKGTRRVESKNGPTDRKMHAYHDIIRQASTMQMYCEEIFRN